MIHDFLAARLVDHMHGVSSRSRSAEASVSGRDWREHREGLHARGRLLTQRSHTPDVHPIDAAGRVDP